MKFGLRVSVFACVGLAVLGCGGGGNSSSGSVATGSNSLNQAITTAATNGSATKDIFASSFNEFKGAYDANPSDPKASVGLALVGSTYYALGSFSTISSGHAVTFTAQSKNPLMRSIENVTLLRMRSKVSGNEAGNVVKTALAPSQQSTATSIITTVNELIYLRSKLVPYVGMLSDANLNAVEANPFLISDPSNTANSVKIGKAELLQLRAALQILIAFADAATTYSFDPGGFDTGVSPASRATAAIASGNPFSSKVFLPGGNFLVKVNDYGTEISSMLMGAGNSVKASAEAIASRTDNAFLLNPSNFDSVDQANMSAQGDGLISAITTPQQYKWASISIGNFLDHLPADLKELLPSVAGVSNGTDHFIKIVAYPDHTFGGLLANMPGDTDDHIAPLENVTSSLTFESYTSYDQLLSDLGNYLSSGALFF